MYGLRTCLLADADLQNSLERRLPADLWYTKKFWTRTDENSVPRGVYYFLISTFKAMINFNFHFAKATTEPLQPLF